MHSAAVRRVHRIACATCAAAAAALVFSGPAWHWGSNRGAPAEAEAERARAEDAVAPRAGQITLRVGGWLIRVERGDPALFAQPEARAALAAKEGRLSAYDHIVHRHAASEGLDWRLVSALIYEESGFRPDSRSPAGAYGLMQVRPAAAEDVGARRYFTPDENVETGVRYLKHLSHKLPRARGRDRLALVLAAYHMGPAHLWDAQRLAERFGYDPNRWENSMDLILPLLEEPEFYRQLEHGYAQGRLTVNYVNRILERYERYKAQAGEWPGFGPPVRAAIASEARGR